MKKTNEQRLKVLLKDLDSLETVVLVERLLKIADITLADIKKKPEAYDNPIFHHSFYVSVMEKIKKHFV